MSVAGKRKHRVQLLSALVILVALYAALSGVRAYAYEQTSASDTAVEYDANMVSYSDVQSYPKAEDTKSTAEEKEPEVNASVSESDGDEYIDNNADADIPHTPDISDSDISDTTADNVEIASDSDAKTDTDADSDISDNQNENNSVIDSIVSDGDLNSDNNLLLMTTKPADGWVSENGELKYYINGEAQSGVIEVNGLIYCVESGKFEAVTGWKVIESKNYYFISGIAQTGIVSIDNKLYMFGSSGELKKASGWQEIADERTGRVERYYFSGNALNTGFTNISGKIYYFDNFGRLVHYEGWKTLRTAGEQKDSIYYFVDGQVCSGIKKIDGELYYFEKNGALCVKNGWVQHNENKYYVAYSRILTGFAEIDGKRYYFDADGSLHMSNGWIDSYGKRYLINNGCVVYGTASHDGKKYYLDPNADGALAYGLISVNGDKYYAGNDGAFQTGLKTLNDKVYYFGSDYKAVKGWETISDKKYFFGDDYYALKGWFKDGGYYYYGGSDGAIKTNCVVDGYQLDANGRRKMSEIEIIANNVINSCTNSSMSSSEKLKACYKWLIDNCSYKRDYADPTKLGSSWTEQYALEMLKTHRGNCYRYASAFAYLAESLGYDASVVTGKITAAGGGMTPHSWTQIKINGTTYLFDANMDDSKGTGFYCYRKTSGSFPYYIVKQKVYDVSI